MLKNLSVGKKISAGFAIIIIIMVAILLLTLFTSLNRNSQLREVEKMNDLQNEMATLQDEFFFARVELRTVYTVYDQTGLDAYQAATGRWDEIQQSLAAIEGMAESLNAENRALAATMNETLRTQFDSFSQYTTAVNGHTLRIMEATQELESILSELTNAGQLYDMSAGLMHSAMQEDAEKAAGYLDNVMVPAEKLIEQINRLGLLSSRLLYQWDTSVSAEMDGVLDEMQQNLEGVLSNITIPAAMDEVNGILATLDTYRNKIQDINVTLEQAAGDVAMARAKTQELDDYLAESISTLTLKVDAMLNSSISTSVFVLVVQLVVTVLAIVFAIFVGYALSRAITRPLAIMERSLLQVGKTGKMSFSDEEKNAMRAEAEKKDEIGSSVKAFYQMMQRMVYISEHLSAIAGGDLSVEVETLSDDDTMGNALFTMIEHLNQMFRDIQSVAAQVSSASSEIAQGAQSLAQGSTEQASTVEEISASINEINEQMIASSQTAEETARHGQKIGEVAGEGNDKMANMMEATQEINEASVNIGNVIKVIDDIAFQTNILALNAAVEAARAGEHGKGFAVVADEVRNLAAKSAEAAKETGVLISANIEKARIGLQISQETAESLSQIIEGTQSANENIQSLAEQSQQARAATAQVTEAIEQVAQVVQENSATSEESAAASQEMSGQAQMLTELISRFKLRNDDGDAYLVEPVPALPAPGATNGGQTDTAGTQKAIIF